VAQEPYDLVFEPDPILDPLWTLLESGAFRDAVEELGGYDTTEMGRRIR
jgi:putative molybdopterin biosynthesis protein